MRRLALFFSIAVLATFLPSCKDDPSPTEPGSAITPSFDLVEDYNTTRITNLIQAIEPPPGQLNATEKRWESIQRQMAMGDLESAQEQMLALADKAVDFCEKGMLLTPTDPAMPETAEEAVAELVMRLFVYVGLADSGALDRYPDFYSGVYEGGDSGFGVIEPGEETIIVTDNQWAAVVAPSGSVDEPVFVTLALRDDPDCNVNSGLQEAYGCWDINRTPEGEFLEPVAVEICVDVADIPLENRDYVLVHKVDENTGDITALPWAEPDNIDCTDFTFGSTEPLVASADPDPGFLKSLGNRVARFFLPDPLVAFPQLSRVPRGIGGLESSFTLHFGAVPDNFPEALLGWWSADNHFLDMYRDNDGQGVGFVPFVPGVSGQAFDLSGSGNEVLIQPLSTEVRELQDLTVATWVYLNPSGPADQIQRFVTLGGGGDKAVLRQESGGNRTLDFFMHFEAPIEIQHVWVDNAFQTGCFHFFAGTYGDDFMRAYLDGVEVGSRYVPAEVIEGSDYAKLGASGGAGAPEEEMDGYLDEVMVFNRALDPSEIQALYELGEGNLCTPGSFPVTYPEVTVDPTYVGADPAIVPTLTEAMTLVRPGGTVWMADGTHNAEDVLVDKPVTIDEVPGATAVIQNDVETRAIRLGDYGSGVVTIQNLDFVNNVEGTLTGDTRSVSIHAVHGWDQVVIQHNDFTSPHAQAVTLVRVDTTLVAGASATIQENTFSGARWGVISTGTAGSSDPFVTVDGNTFTNQTAGGVNFQLEAYGIVSSNDLTNCGDRYCVYAGGASHVTVTSNTITNGGEISCIYIAGGSQVAVTDNVITDHTAHPGGDPTYYHTGIYSSSPIGPISGNTFDGCGWGSCIEVNGAWGADTDIHNNTITAYGADQTEVGILAYGGDHADIGDAYPPTVRITDNVLVGVGSLSTDYEDFNNPFYHGGILIRNAYADDISRNQITNAAAGIYMYQNGFVYAGSDNVFDQTVVSIRGGANADITMTGNDFTTTNWSIVDNDATLKADLTCNWWGNAAGPTSNSFPPTSNPIVYWPWTNGAVANGGPGTCYAEANIQGQFLLDGAPINGATVTATGPQTLGATTNEYGNYLFYNLLPGTYTVSISPSLGVYPFTSQVVLLAPGESATVDFSGAYYPSVGSSGIGSATSWVVSQPSAGMNLCNGEGSSSCADNETVTLEARATGPSSDFLHPDWDEVHFYFRETSPGAFYRYAATGAIGGAVDNGVTRQWWWTATLDLDGLEIPTGTIEVIAIGVDGEPNTYHTPVPNTNITIVEGILGGGD